MEQASKLAIVIRQFQWELDDLAFRLPRAKEQGTVTKEECNHLADTIDTLSILLRKFDPDAEFDEPEPHIIEMDQNGDESGKAQLRAGKDL